MPYRALSEGVVVRAGLAAVAIYSGISWFARVVVLEALEDELEEELMLSAAHAETVVEAWARAHRISAAAWAQSPPIVAAVETLAALPTPALHDHPLQVELRALMSPLVTQDDHRGYFLIDPGGRNLASSRTNPVGTPHPLADDWFATGRLVADGPLLSPVVPSDVPLADPSGALVAGWPTQFAGAAVRDAAGTVIGGFTWRLRPERDLAQLVDSLRPREDARVYLVDAQGRARSPLPAAAGALQAPLGDVLGRRQHNPAVDALVASQGAGVRIDPTPGFAGDPVVVAWRWIPSLDMGLVLSRPAESALYLDRIVRFVSLMVIVLGVAMGLVATELARRYARQQISLGAELRRRVAEQTEALRAAVGRLKLANEDLEAFAQGASHDLRAPLRDIRSLASWLVEDAVDKLDAEELADLEMIVARAERLDRLLVDLRDHARMGRSPAALQQVALPLLVDEVLALVPPRPGIAVEVGRLPAAPLWLAPAALQLVLRNLVSNAVRHHDGPAGRVQLWADLEGDALVVHVKDDGPGIPRALQDQAFAPFRTLQTREEGAGSGMGLALVQRQVTTIGGRLSLESVGRGCHFTVHWPVQREAPPGAPAGPSPGAK